MRNNYNSLEILLQEAGAAVAPSLGTLGSSLGFEHSGPGGTLPNALPIQGSETRGLDIMLLT